MKKICILLFMSICRLGMSQPTSNPNFLSDFGFTNGGWRNGETVRLAADVNGDGKADVVGFSGNAVRVGFSKGTSFSPVQVLNQDFNGWSYQKHIRTAGDINGDGKADLVGFGDTGTFVAFSTGNGFGPLHLILNDFGNVNGGWDPAVTVRCVGDVNGDGKADAIGFSNGDVRVSFSNGATLYPCQVLNSDFQGWSYTAHVRTVADVDGDGKTDLVGFGSKGTYVCFSTGNSFESGKLMINDFGTDSGWDASRMKRIMADMNGDGKADILGYNGNQVVVSYSKGRGGFEPPKAISYDFSNRTNFSFDKYIVTAADVDGNKSADLIGFGDAGVIVQLTDGPATSQAQSPARLNDQLCCDQELKFSDEILAHIESPNGRFFLVFQNDRNLVVYQRISGDAKALWATATNNNADRCVMQADGNFVIYNGTRPVWSSNTYGNPNAKLVMQNDGNLVIYSTAGRALWASNTQQPEEAKVRDRLCCDQELKFSDDVLAHIESPNGQFFLVFQNDRNAVLYQRISGDVKALWATATNNNANRCVMQADGNFVIYNGTKPVWSSNTYGNPNAYLVMQDDGNLVIYANGRALWATNTVQAIAVVAPVVAPIITPVKEDVAPCSMQENLYNAAVEAVRAQSFKDGKIRMAKQAIKNKCLSLDQIRGIAKLFDFEDQTLEFLLYAYDFTNSKGEYYTLGNIFSFDSNTQKFTTFLESK